MRRAGPRSSLFDDELLTIRNGLIVRIREFYDESNAREAAGLSE